MAHCHARMTGSKASSPSSASAAKNWMAKKGFPPVFSCTSCAKGISALQLAVQAICDELAHIVQPER